MPPTRRVGGKTPSGRCYAQWGFALASVENWVVRVLRMVVGVTRTVVGLAAVVSLIRCDFLGRRVVQTALVER